MPEPTSSAPPSSASPAYAFFPDIAAEVDVAGDDRIVSRTLTRAPGAKAVLFGFSPGQELSEHTSARPAIVHVLDGRARLTLGADAFEVGPGAWAQMPPNLPHSITAITPVRMLLLMLDA